MIQFTCGSCSKNHKADDSFAWKIGKCTCWALIKIWEPAPKQEEQSWYFCPFCKKSINTKPVKTYEWFTKFICESCSKKSYEWHNALIKAFLVFVIMTTTYFIAIVWSDEIPFWAIFVAAWLLWKGSSLDKVICKK